jgi:hypothetical protein
VSQSEFDVEPIRGLPEKPPQGEHILWQGVPSMQGIVRHAFYARILAGYFIVLIGVSTGVALAEGHGMDVVLQRVPWLVGFAIFVLAIAWSLAWLIHRTTVYTITNRRLVMRFGLALPMAVNIPFSIVEAAGKREYGDGAGDIALTLKRDQSPAYLLMWPHVRPWRFGRPQPMLRAIDNIDGVADLLTKSLKAV